MSAARRHALDYDIADVVDPPSSRIRIKLCRASVECGEDLGPAATFDPPVIIGIIARFLPPRPCLLALPKPLT